MICCKPGCASSFSASAYSAEAKDAMQSEQGLHEAAMAACHAKARGHMVCSNRRQL